MDSPKKTLFHLLKRFMGTSVHFVYVYFDLVIIILIKHYRYGEVDKLELLTTKDSPGGVTAVVSFLSLQIAAKIHKMSHKISNNALTTRYHDFSSNNVSHNNDPKTEVKDKRSRDEPFHRYVLL